MKKKIILAMILLVFVAFFLSHSFIDGKIYPKYQQKLDLRNKEIATAHYDQIRATFPDKEILWNVPFQGGYIANDSTTLTTDALSHEDVAVLDYLEALEMVDARGCTDYAALTALIQRRPELDVRYTVTIDGVDYPQDATTLKLERFTAEELALLQYLPDITTVEADACREYDLLLALQAQKPHVQISYQVDLDGKLYSNDTTALELQNTSTVELLEKLQYLPQLERVSVIDPECGEVNMTQLTEHYSDVAFYWEKEVAGLKVTSEEKELDFSNHLPQSLAYLEQELKNFPGLERVYLGYCKLDNEELAAYRERVRPEYKLVWNILIGAEYIDTDATWFMPGKTGRGLMEHQAVLLKYCEDMICIDIGHKLVETCEFVRYMPNLKYLIMACSSIRDITPLETCKNLIYLELFESPNIKDYTPLLGCTSLEDLNISMTVGDPEPILQMYWLKRLHWCSHEELREQLEIALPNTELMIAPDPEATGQGWRQSKNYYDMRDILGMYYMW